MSSTPSRLHHPVIAALPLSDANRETLTGFLASVAPSAGTVTKGHQGGAGPWLVVSGAGGEPIAQAVATCLSKELRAVAVADVSSKFIAETEKKIEMLLDVAESENWLLFFDEADALFGKRSEIADPGEHFSNPDTSYVLQHLDHFSGPIVFSLINEAAVDSISLSRFRWIVRG
jgi:hypothetical protein